jgi:hypothetical protein
MWPSIYFRLTSVAVGILYSLVWQDFEMLGISCLISVLI